MKAIVYNSLPGIKIFLQTEISERLRNLLSRAVGIIANYPQVDRQKSVRVILTSGGAAQIPLLEQQIGIYIKNLIVFDVGKMEKYLDWAVTVEFLEEFCHVYFNIDDETLVTHKVVELFPDVEVRDGQYHLRA